MSHDLSSLRVDRVIVHDVPQRRVSQVDSELLLSEAESELDVELQNYLYERIASSLNKAASEVVLDPDSSSLVPTQIRKNIDNVEVDFVDSSGQIARHLFGAQTGVNSAGLLVVVQASILNARSLAILKLEREAGLRAQPRLIDGKRTFKIEHIKELMLTQRTRVFKVGLFWRGEDEIEGLVADEQRPVGSGPGVADFFLKRFLGCRHRVLPEVKTKQFYFATEEFINKGVDNPQDKARYRIALSADMSSTSADIDPRRFAETHFRLEDRLPFQQWIESAGLEMSAFPKDVSLIDPVLRRVEINFKNGVVVLGPSDTFDQDVKMTDGRDGRTRLEIEDTVEKVKGRR